MEIGFAGSNRRGQFEIKLKRREISIEKSWECKEPAPMTDTAEPGLFIQRLVWLHKPASDQLLESPYDSTKNLPIDHEKENPENLLTITLNLAFPGTVRQSWPGSWGGGYHESFSEMKSPNNLQKLIVCRRTFKKYPTIRYTIFEWNVTDNQNKAETASVENFSFLQATAYQLKLDYYFQKFRIRSLLFNWSSISRQVVGDMSVQIKERWSDYSFSWWLVLSVWFYWKLNHLGFSLIQSSFKFVSLVDIQLSPFELMNVESKEWIISATQKFESSTWDSFLIFRKLNLK